MFYCQLAKITIESLMKMWMKEDREKSKKRDRIKCKSHRVATGMGVGAVKAVNGTGCLVKRLIKSFVAWNF